MHDASPSLVKTMPSGDSRRDARTGRATYTLCYDDAALGLPKRIEFEAESPAKALEIAGGEADGRQALLFVDGEPLCRLVKASAAETHPTGSSRVAKAVL
ncbi:MAG TPA: hypothetical protein VN047_21215 [Sphingopyxis sp.]|uniref:hypothetical protein n=1 Tax=Sphingopyxis sp. TaxID=1908224 RepID=UPI002CAA14DB|nr:hypothetical protein [Sphingopyxis sp.]HWW59426.1 hypothetical protein [Sphingopyxis sp.]